MHSLPLEVLLDISPSSRLDLIDIHKKITDEVNGESLLYKKATYCSFHTTAGYLEQSICSRLDYQKDHIKSFIKAFQKLFPVNGDYHHDQMDLRKELDETQRQCEPKNGDSHLTFISSGLRNCVTYQNKPDIPVYFIDLDGVHEHGQRNRHTSVMYYNQEEIVHKHVVDVPVSKHPIDAINLRDKKLGYIDKLNSLLAKYKVQKGRVEISLDSAEKNAGLTVNEYETLLMENDLMDVLKNPLQFMSEKTKHILQNPKHIPSRTIDYARYDFVRIFNELMDALHVSQSVLEKILARFLALPAERFLRVKRNINFLVSNNNNGSNAELVQGTYQSPILVQWKEAKRQTRYLNITITRFK